MNSSRSWLKEGSTPRNVQPAPRLHKVAARNVAQTHQIWKHSPVVKVVPEALRAEAVKRMEARKVTGEKVKAIAADLNLSVGCLYKWVSAAKQTVN